MLAIISLLLIVTFSLLVTRTAAVALVYTGLSQEAARFQARSAFTGVGYTTSEAEEIVNHPVRRQIVMLLMLLGNAGVVTAVSSLIVTFVNAPEPMDWWLRPLAILGGLVLIVLVGKIGFVDRLVRRLIEAGLERLTKIKSRDFAQLLHLSGTYGVSELAVEEDDWLRGKLLGETGLAREGVVVLGIQHADGQYLAAPTAEAKIEAHDRLVVYGCATHLAELDQRCAGSAGDQLHNEACERFAEAAEGA